MCSKQTWNSVCTFSKHRETCIRYDPQIVGPTELIGAQTLQWCLLQACTEHDATSSESTLTWQGAKKQLPWYASNCWFLNSGGQLPKYAHWPRQLCLHSLPGAVSLKGVESLLPVMQEVFQGRVYTHIYIHIYIYVYIYVYTIYIYIAYPLDLPFLPLMSPFLLALQKSPAVVGQIPINVC